MKLKYVLIAILCLNNQTIKSNDEIIEYGKIAALSIGTALGYGLVHHGVAARICPAYYKLKESPLVQAIKSHGQMGGIIGMSLIGLTALEDTPTLTTERLLLPMIITLTGVETASLLAGIHAYRNPHSFIGEEKYISPLHKFFIIQAANKMADRAGIAALIGLDLYFAKKAFLT